MGRVPRGGGECLEVTVAAAGAVVSVVEQETVAAAGAVASVVDQVTVARAMEQEMVAVHGVEVEES